MPDQFDRKKRSEIMAKVHSTDTAPEIRIHGVLEEMGYNFFLQSDDLPGKPDMLLPDYDTGIFVHGCFWHGCPVCRHAKIRPKENAEYWNKKLDRTLEGDKENKIKLEQLGYKVLIIWECETKKKKIDVLKNKIFEFLK
jgi:DNA mismatch endonuclease (patch repair protein)